MNLAYQPRAIPGAPQDKAAYLNQVLGDGDDLGSLLQAMARLADSKKGGIANLAKDAGLSRTNLYKILYDQSDVRSSTLIALLRAFNLRITIEVDSDDDSEFKPHSKPLNH